jgi:hypothetical protein|nr:MAG TPA: hypothetical protein [Caudoviricetes sp.]
MNRVSKLTLDDIKIVRKRVEVGGSAPSTKQITLKFTLVDGSEVTKTVIVKDEP